MQAAGEFGGVLLFEQHMHHFRFAAEISGGVEQRLLEGGVVRGDGRLQQGEIVQIDADEVAIGVDIGMLEEVGRIVRQLGE